MVLYNLNQVTVKGLITYVSNQDTYSTYLARVYTGEKRKETDEYAPSVTVSFILNEKEVKLLNLKKGDNVIISGKLSSKVRKDSDVVPLVYVDVSLPFTNNDDAYRSNRQTDTEVDNSTEDTNEIF